MKTVSEHGYATYPRRFDAYKWYKPLLVGLLYGVFSIIGGIVIELITKLVFSATVRSTGYDDMDFFTAAGAFKNGALAAIAAPCLILAALAVKDRPISSYFSSMGGWRWKVFFKPLAAGLLIVGIPNIVWFSLPGKTGGVKFTISGFILLTLFVPLQSLGEEVIYRGFFMQTVSSWFKLTAVGVIVQTLIFTVVHPYNIIGIISIAVSGLLYALICIFSKGIESPTVMHFFNNVTEIYMAGFGFRLITAEQTIPDTVVNLTIKILFFLFILYADKKLHWFDEVKYDDVALFNSKENDMTKEK